MKRKNIISGFSRLSKEKKIELVSILAQNPDKFISDIKSFWHADSQTQQLFDEFSENTISNFYLPYGVAPNFLIDGKKYIVPMVIEESSVIAAASNSAKWWSTRGGFQTEIISTKKVGQVHFVWQGDLEKLRSAFPRLKLKLIDGTKEITSNMVNRGGE